MFYFVFKMAFWLNLIFIFCCTCYISHTCFKLRQGHKSQIFVFSNFNVRLFSLYYLFMRFTVNSPFKQYIFLIRYMKQNPVLVFIVIQLILLSWFNKPRVLLLFQSQKVYLTYRPSPKAVFKH